MLLYTLHVCMWTRLRYLTIIMYPTWLTTCFVVKPFHGDYDFQTIWQSPRFTNVFFLNCFNSKSHKVPHSIHKIILKKANERQPLENCIVIPIRLFCLSTTLLRGTVTFFFFRTHYHHCWSLLRAWPMWISK